MDILFIADSYPRSEGFYEGINIKLKAEMLARKHTVTVIAPVPLVPGIMSVRYPKYLVPYRQRELEGRNLRIFRPRYFAPPLRWPLFHFLDWTGFLLAVKGAIAAENIGFDLMHAHFGYAPGYAAALLKERNNKPLVTTFYGTDINAYACYPVLRSYISRALRDSDMVFTVSGSLAKKAKKMGAREDKMRIIHEGIDVDMFGPRDKMKARAKLGIEEDRKVLLFVGSLIPVKGLSVLLESLVLARRRVRNLSALFVGEGRNKELLRAQCMSLGLEDMVGFAGAKPHDEIPLWMAASDALVLPSKSEGLPTVIMESLACGRPVVATDVDGVREAVTNPDLGVLVAPDDPEDLARGIVEACSSDWDSSQISTYAKRFSREKLIEETERRYGELPGGI